ncbi:hypothetical protein SEA_COMRADE_229 [Streptomyces phage Comrade]|uniref:Uncharacterized protein n=3 Tax=Gilsonvirus comrade TaxID=2846395 RepID=A0A345MED0_9CAUD|nr:hypothetical protein HWB84_gp049 [Streptomyces phage Comrade]AXH68911.1 hypothetical protein SEA_SPARKLEGODDESS_232 [Streptomyces phage SparkleGoddess]AXQ63464.1 hypothetical protein SEA_COMRADE_229 [Streptomyces phage Comrade]QQO39885.1 membrane protein [Streptomyces phage Belfort]QZE11794.1 membrane protein [Streptomyces phage Karp]
MDDALEAVLFCFVLPILLVLLVFGLIGLAENADNAKKGKEDKRYELCLKRDMQWVDGNCLTK